jgi:hypothetical protein
MVESYRLFGRAMLEHLDGGLGKYSYERDDGFLDPADVRPYFAPYRKWPADSRRGSSDFASAIDAKSAPGSAFCS